MTHLAQAALDATTAEVIDLAAEREKRLAATKPAEDGPTDREIVHWLTTCHTYVADATVLGTPFSWEVAADNLQSIHDLYCPCAEIDGLAMDCRAKAAKLRSAG